MNLKFRKLKESEIEVRIGSVKDSGLSLLLYKNARTDMKLLDEQGVKWQRDHKELKGNIYCGIGIYDDELEQWLWRWDAGSESYSDKEKGEASDSFKRAGFNWGIGTELYTSPFIWIDSSKCTIKNRKCYDKFEVEKITYDKDGRVDGLAIINTSKGNSRVFVQKPRGE